MTTEEFRKAILEGIPEELPEPKAYDESINHAPKRKDILSDKEKALALKNARTGHSTAWRCSTSPR